MINKIYQQYHASIFSTKMRFVITNYINKKNWCTHQSYGPKKFPKEHHCSIKNVSFTCYILIGQCSKCLKTHKQISKIYSIMICRWTMCMSVSSEEIRAIIYKQKNDAISIDRSSRDCSIDSMWPVCNTTKRNNIC